MSIRYKFFIANVAAIALLCTAANVQAERGSVSKSQTPREGHEVVDMFAAMESGDIEVKFIPKDVTAANIIVTNKSDKPLAVKMPAAFAGVPVLGQFGGGGGMGGGGMGGGMGGGGMGGGGGMQGGGGGMGGGMGGGGFGGGMGGGGMGGGGMFNIAPGKVGKVKVAFVCLEHGKADPRPKIKYEIKPITALTDKPEIAELFRMMASDEISRDSAQASAWHVENGLSWRELASKDKVRLSNGYVEKYFNYNTLVVAKRAGEVAVARAKERAKTQKEDGSYSYQETSVEAKKESGQNQQ